MTVDEFSNWLNGIAPQIEAVAPDIIAETATEYYRARFREKAWDSNPWVAGKPKRGGSLLVQSGNLMNSIRPAVIAPDRVVISAGNDKVGYARAHNEGVDEDITIPQHVRKTKKGTVTVKQHTRHMQPPKRQFPGDAPELTDEIKRRLDDELNNILNP
jgi:phage gpG-like protein